MIEITHYKSINKNSLIATFSVKMQKWGNFQIRDCTLFQKGSQRWMSYPSRKYNADGKDKYFAFCGFEDRETNEAFQKKVLDAVDKYLITNPQPQDPTAQMKYISTDDEIPF